MKKKQLVFRPTGERRNPKKDEIYLQQHTFRLSTATDDWTTSESGVYIYSAVEEVIDVPLWRQKYLQCYWYCGSDMHLLTDTDTYNAIDMDRYTVGNYFQDGIEASKYADLIRFVLTERLLDNPEFCKVIEKLKGELA